MDLDNLRKQLDSIGSEAKLYFAAAQEHWKQTIESFGAKHRALFQELAPELATQGSSLRLRTSQIASEYMATAAGSLLLTEADQLQIRVAFRSIANAFLMRSYWYRAPEAVGDHNRVYGITNAEHEERDLAPEYAFGQFNRSIQSLFDKLDLLAPSEQNLTRAIVQSELPEIRKYRPNTAFIIMQINKAIPKLEDVKNSIKEVFAQFGVTAVRSDEIEHQEVITQRILDEISTSEFLMADLTGERPSVYYEVGYAHALKRRPILFRENGTPLHFDLLLHNVPEYDNITDLKKQLTSRLIALTGREPMRK